MILLTTLPTSNFPWIENPTTSEVRYTGDTSYIKAKNIKKLAKSKKLDFK